MSYAGGVSLGEQRSHFQLRMMLQRLFDVLRELDGYFVFSDEEGKEYVIVRRENFEERMSSHAEIQLPLPSASRSPDRRDAAGEILERINREVAAYHLQQAEQDIMEPGDEALEQRKHEHFHTAEVPPARRVRFEPLAGDLPPELQD